MSSCLGLYIQDNLIKYAKVTKDKEILKVDAFGVKFYDNLTQAINQIVAETFSYRIPISINLSEESYNYFYLFSLLNKNDLKKAIDTEFDSFCYDNSYNKNALEYRYALVTDVQSKEKIKVINTYANKAEINRKLQELEEHTISTIVPLPMCIPNIADIKEKENAIIVNIEDKTTITTILDQNIYHVDKIEQGTAQILNSIKEKENSYTKAYEICKNTTIYTMEGRDLAQEENLYLPDIMPTLYEIVQQVKKIVDDSLTKIEKIYITGTASTINNIDLYFQEYFPDAKCQILKPHFIPDTVKINMKDYIEVNSAIALALQGLGNGIRTINFKTPTFADKIPDWMKIKIGESNTKTKKTVKFDWVKKLNLSTDFKATLDNTEKWLVRTITGILMFIIIYSGCSMFLKVQTDKKLEQIQEIKNDTTSQITLVENDIQKIYNKTTRYETITKRLQSYKNEFDENRKVKDSIPNLLTSIMSSMPQQVTITSIKNTTGYTIRIEAEAKEYAQLGYFIGNIKTTGILYNVTSSSGVKQNDVIKVTIEGNLFPE